MLSQSGCFFEPFWSETGYTEENVHINPDKFRNASLVFSHFGLPSVFVRRFQAPKMDVFESAFQEYMNLKMPARTAKTERLKTLK